MADTKVRVLARVIALPDKVEEAKTVLLSLIRPTRQEPGCIRYELWQERENRTNFNWVEEWESQVALDQHLTSAHFQEANSKLASLLATEPVIGFYQLVA